MGLVAGLGNLLAAASGGQVGHPNYTHGERARDPSRWNEVQDELRNGRITARSSASGLGQLLLNNVERYYPCGRRRGPHALHPGAPRSASASSLLARRAQGSLGAGAA